MNREEYKRVAEELYAKPPIQETLDGQKFNIGDIVKIVRPSSWFSAESFSLKPELQFQVEYSYAQKYWAGEGNTKKYCLKDLSTGYSSSWYREEELELVAPTITPYQQGFNDAKEAILKLMDSFDIEFRNEAIRKVQELTPPKIDYNRPLIKELLK